MEVFQADKLDNFSGMTLVELMVAISVTLLVMTLTVSIFMSQYKNYIKRRDTNEIHESVPPIVELIKRDFLEAGWAVRPEMAFYIEDGGSDGSDRIYLSDSTIIDIEHSSEITEFLQEDCSGCVRIENLPNHVPRLDIDDEENDNDLTGKDFVASSYQFIVTSSASNRIARIGNILTDGSLYNLELYDTQNTPQPIDLATGTYVAPAVYYCIDDGQSPQCHPNGDPSKWVLRRSDRNSGGRRRLAQNVVDLQIAYQDSDGIWYGTRGCEDRGDCAPASFNSANIKMIRFTIVTRSDHRDKALSNDSNYCRPSVENRGAAQRGSEDCGYTYRTFTAYVRPRNIL